MENHQNIKQETGTAKCVCLHRLNSLKN